ncbi:MAG: NAD(P)-dependent oxidoreductase [Thermodesulfobacteriota bacterium]
MKAISDIGFIGLGNMGRPMAARLAEAGFNLTVFDLNSRALKAFSRQYHAKPAACAGDAGRNTQAVITMLPDGDTVRRVVLEDGPGGRTSLLSAMSPKAVLIDMSSSAPGGTRELGRILAGKDLAMIDAPVSGGVARAKSGTLAIMAGGRKSQIKHCRPLLLAMGGRIFETGPLGSGHAMKVLNNLVSAAGLIAAAEALIVGRRFDLDPEVMIDVLNASTGRNNSTENKFKQFILARTFNSGFSLDLMIKDLSTAVQMARETRTPAIFGSLCRELWAASRSVLPEGADHTAVVCWLEALSGEKLAG